MARNPKDLVVSYYQFHRSLRTMSYRGTFQEFCRRFMNDKCKIQLSVDMLLHIYFHLCKYKNEVDKDAFILFILQGGY